MSRLAQRGSGWPRVRPCAAHRYPRCGALQKMIGASDGTPARLNALMNAFRDMKPYLAHAFQLKRFWQTGVLATSDVDIQRWVSIISQSPHSASLFGPITVTVDC